MELWQLTAILNSAQAKLMDFLISKGPLEATYKNLETLVYEANNLLEEYDSTLQANLGVELCVDARFSQDLPKRLIFVPYVRPLPVGKTNE